MARFFVNRPIVAIVISIITVLLGPAIAEGNVLEVAGLHYTFGPPAHTSLMICILVLIPFTGLYTFIGGLWGVLVTDHCAGVGGAGQDRRDGCSASAFDRD